MMAEFVPDPKGINQAKRGNISDKKNNNKTGFWKLSLRISLYQCIGVGLSQILMAKKREIEETIYL